MTLHPVFVCQMTGVSEKLFSNPEIEAELSVQLRKKHHNTQLSVFNRLQTAAIRKLEELDEFVGLPGSSKGQRPLILWVTAVRTS